MTSSTERIRFQNPSGQELVGILHLPSPPVRDVAVILSHGMLSSKDSQKHVALCEKLTEVGFPAFRFDFSGVGESQGPPEVMTFGGRAEDLQAAIRMLEQRGMQRFVLEGSSMGAGVSLLVGAQMPERVLGLALLAAAVKSDLIWESMSSEQLDAWKRAGVSEFEGHRISYDVVTDGEKQNIPGALASFKNPVLFVHGLKDELIDPYLVQQISISHPGRTEVLLVDEADHRFSQDEHREQAINAIRDWIVKIAT